MFLVEEDSIPLDSETVKKAAREAIVAVARRPVHDEQRVVSTGMINSLSVLKLIVILETKLQILIPKDQVQPEDFDSVEMILDTLERVAQ